MLSTLCRSVATCHRRRLARATGAAPLPVALAVALVVLAPFVFVRIGRAIGAELSDAVGEQGVADALVLGPALAAAVAGAACALVLPGRSGLGQQLAASPCGDVAVILVGLVVPAVVCAIAVLPSLIAMSVGLAGELPGGVPAGLALTAATAAAAAAGAIAAEAGLAVARGQWRRVVVVGWGVIAWILAGAAAGTVPLGPLAGVAGALSGFNPPATALGSASALALGLTLGWVMLASRRPPKPSRPARRSRASTRCQWPAVPVAIVALLVRRSDVRLSTVAAVGFGAIGVAIAGTASTPVPTAFLLATTTTLFGSLVCSLATCGVLVTGRWLWLRGSPGAVVGISVLVGVVVSATPVAVVGGAAAVVSGVTLNAAGSIAGFVVVGTAMALLSGALVPWHSGGIGDQAASFAALIAVAVAASLGIGLIGPRLVEFGLPDPIALLIVCVASVMAALFALDRRLRCADG